MNRFTVLWHKSMTFFLIHAFTKRWLPALRRRFYDGFFWHLWLWFDQKVLHSPYLIWRNQPWRLSALFRSSYFYFKSTAGMRKLAAHIPRASLPDSPLYPLWFLAVFLFLPDWAVSAPLILFLYTAAAMLFFSRHCHTPVGISFGFIQLVLLLFGILLALTMPHSAVGTVFCLLIGIGFFFWLSFSLTTKAAFGKGLQLLYALCLLFWDRPQLLLLLFPFAMAAPMELSSKARRIGYPFALLIFAFFAIAANGSRGLLIGFSVEVLLLFLLIYGKYLPVLLLLAPALTFTALKNLTGIWAAPATGQNFLSSAIAAFYGFWNKGFGINRGALLRFYPSQSVTQVFSLSFLLEFGFLALVLFAAYLLYIARGALVSAFTAPKPLRHFFAAGFITLVGISVSSLMGALVLTPTVLIAYWSIPGMIRAARVLEQDTAC